MACASRASLTSLLLCWAAGLVMIAPFLPAVALALTATLYLVYGGDWVRTFSPTGGTVLVGGLVAGLLAGQQARAESANRNGYGELISRFHALQEKVRRVSIPSADQWVRCQVERHQCFIEREMNKVGLRWVLGSGYLNIWSALLHAEEALMRLDSDQMAIADAIHDEMRLESSEIPQKEALLIKLRRAVFAIKPASVQLLIQSPPANTGTAAPPAQVDARNALREVRGSINEYRHERWAAILRERNLFSASHLLAGITAYALLALAVIFDAPERAVVAAPVFFLVGALGGLLGRAYVGGRAADEVMNDYGYASVRLLATPVFSGLAAIGGVVVVALASGAYQDIQTSTVTQPGATAAATAAPITTPDVLSQPAPVALVERESCMGVRVTVTGCPALDAPSSRTSLPPTQTSQTEEHDALPALDEIFDLGRNQFQIVLAAVFGLAPETLLTALRQRGDQLKRQLASSQPYGSAAASS